MAMAEHPCAYMLERQRGGLALRGPRALPVPLCSPWRLGYPDRMQMLP